MSIHLHYFICTKHFLAFERFIKKNKSRTDAREDATCHKIYEELKNYGNRGRNI